MKNDVSVSFLHNRSMRKIFVVEDDPGIRETLEILLTDEGFLVQSFGAVAEFNRRDKTILPDLFLFDVMLPDGSGTDLCRKIKGNEDSMNVPVIIMSAHAELKDISYECLPNDFIPKPFDIDDLLLRIDETLR